jgi:hypothetical protein
VACIRHALAPGTCPSRHVCTLVCVCMAVLTALTGNEFSMTSLLARSANRISSGTVIALVRSAVLTAVTPQVPRSARFRFATSVPPRKKTLHSQSVVSHRRIQEWRSTVIDNIPFPSPRMAGLMAYSLCFRLVWCISALNYTTESTERAYSSTVCAGLLTPRPCPPPWLATVILPTTVFGRTP